MIHHNPALSGPYSTGSPRSATTRITEGFEVERSSPLSTQPWLPTVKRPASVDLMEVGLQTHLPLLLSAKARPFTVSGLIPLDPINLVVFFRSKVRLKLSELLKLSTLNRYLSLIFTPRTLSRIPLISRSISIMIGRQLSMFSRTHVDPTHPNTINTPRHANPSSIHQTYHYPPLLKSQTIRSSRPSGTRFSPPCQKAITSPPLEICWKSYPRVVG